MTPQIAKNTIEFLNRVQLSATEVPAFTQCQASLMMIVEDANIQKRFDDFEDARRTPSGAVKPPDEFKGD